MKKTAGNTIFFLSKSSERGYENGEFIEWEEVYKDQLYGTLKKRSTGYWTNGNHVLFDVDVKGGINLKKIFGHKAISIFIMPPSKKELEKRLRHRGTDDPCKNQNED